MLLIPEAPFFIYLQLMISHVIDFNSRNRAITAQLLKRGYPYYKLRYVCSKIYHRYSGLVDKYNVSLKKLLQQSVSEPEVVYKIGVLDHHLIEPSSSPKEDPKPQFRIRPHVDESGQFSSYLEGSPRRYMIRQKDHLPRRAST